MHVLPPTGCYTKIIFIFYFSCSHDLMRGLVRFGQLQYFKIVFSQLTEHQETFQQKFYYWYPSKYEFYETLLCSLAFCFRIFFLCMVVKKTASYRKNSQAYIKEHRFIFNISIIPYHRISIIPYHYFLFKPLPVIQCW